MYKKFIFILSVFIFVFSIVSSSSFADGGVLGITYDVPESPDYPNHTYILIYERFMGDSGDGIFLIKYYMPVSFRDRSSSTIGRLELSFSNALFYKYNSSTDTFEPFGSQPYNDRIDGYFLDESRGYLQWNDPDVFYYGFKPLSANHNIYLNDGTLFFWTPQQNINCPHLYRLPVTEMMKTLLVVGGRTLGIALMIFGIVLGILWAKRLISSFLL